MKVLFLVVATLGLIAGLQLIKTYELAKELGSKKIEKGEQ